jgi:hypothetical protein
VTYTPHRDERFEYITDLMGFIEENQCTVCYFRSDREEYPMCFEIEGQIFTEEPVAELEDVGTQGVVCTKFRLDDPPEPVDTNQIPLFDI